MTDDIQPTILKAERNFRGDGTTRYELWMAGLTSQGVKARARSYATRQSRTTNVDVDEPEETNVPARSKPLDADIPDAARVFKVEARAPA